MDVFRRTGPDLNIISYALNPIINGERNTDPKVTNDFNDKLFKKLSVQRQNDPIPQLYVTSSIFESDHSGAPITYLREQLGVDQSKYLDMNFLITTIMNPWLSDTENGTRNMIPEVFSHLQVAAEAVADELSINAPGPHWSPTSKPCSLKPDTRPNFSRYGPAPYRICSITTTPGRSSLPTQGRKWPCGR